MSVDAISWAFKQHADATAKLILICLADHCDADGSCWPAQSRIADRCCVSVNTVRRHLLALEEAGLLRREKRHREDGTQTSDRFLLLLHTEGVPHQSEGVSPHDEGETLPLVGGHEPSLEPSEVKEDTSLRSVSKKSQPKRATRIPTDFQCDLDEAERLGLSRRAAEQEAAAFADYWRAKPVNATKLDWPATWRNWVRKATKDQQGGRGNGQFEFRQGVIVKPAVISESPTRAAIRIARGGG